MYFNKKILQLSLIVILAICSNIARAELPKNAAYIELGGNAGAYSLNYERKINPTLGTRIGVGYIGYIDDESYKKSKNESFLLVPIMLFKLWGGENSNHYFETALGVIYAEASEKDEYLNYNNKGRGVLGTATLGYRYAPKKKGFLFRIGITPIISTNTILPWIGMSFGYSF